MKNTKVCTTGIPWLMQYPIMQFRRLAKKFEKHTIRGLIIFLLFLKILANFGGDMGCAIGMTLISAFEIFYWIIVKPFLKLMDNQNPSPTLKWFSRKFCWLAFVALTIFSSYRFFLVYQLNEEKEKENP